MLRFNWKVAINENFFIRRTVELRNLFGRHKRLVGITRLHRKHINKSKFSISGHIVAFAAIFKISKWINLSSLFDEWNLTLFRVARDALMQCSSPRKWTSWLNADTWVMESLPSGWKSKTAIVTGAWQNEWSLYFWRRSQLNNTRVSRNMTLPWEHLGDESVA